MDLRLFPTTDVVKRVGTVEAVSERDLTFLAKKPRSQRRSRLVVPLKDVAWYVQGGNRDDRHPDILYLRPTAFQREPVTAFKNVEVQDGEDLRTFSADNRTIVVVNEDLVSISCQEDVVTEAEKKKQPNCLLYTSPSPRDS